MVTTPKIVRIETGRYETPLVFELDPQYIATDPITVLVALKGQTIHVELWQLDDAVKRLHRLAAQDT